MEALIKDAALVTILEEIAAAYRDLYPERYEVFKKTLNEENKSLLKPSAMSGEKTMMSYCIIPTELYSFIKWQMRKRAGIKDFFSEEKNYRLLCRVWSQARVRHEATTAIHIGRSNPIAKEPE